MFINYVKKKKKKSHRGHLFSFPIVALSDTLGFVMSLKILSSINGAIAIQRDSGKGL